MSSTPPLYSRTIKNILNFFFHQTRTRMRTHNLLRWCCKSFMKRRSTLINNSDAALAKWRDAFRLLALRRLGCSSSRLRIIRVKIAIPPAGVQCSRVEGREGKKRCATRDQSRVEISAAPTTTLLSRQFIYLIYLFSVFSYNTPGKVSSCPSLSINLFRRYDNYVLSYPMYGYKRDGNLE